MSSTTTPPRTTTATGSTTATAPATTEYPGASTTSTVITPNGVKASPPGSARSKTFSSTTPACTYATTASTDFASTPCKPSTLALSPKSSGPSVMTSPANTSSPSTTPMTAEAPSHLGTIPTETSASAPPGT